MTEEKDVISGGLHGVAVLLPVQVLQVVERHE